MSLFLALPPGQPLPALAPGRFGDLECEGPAPTAPWMAGLVSRLQAAVPALRAHSVATRADALARATARFGVDALATGPGGPTPPFLASLEAVSGYSRPVLEWGLSRATAVVTAEALLDWWGGRGAVAPAGPARVGVVAAGNIPGVALTPVLLALLSGAPVLVKLSRAEPLVLPAWHRVLTAVAPDLAAACAAVPWAGGDESLEQAAFGGADRLLAFGSDSTMVELERRFPGRVCGYGTGLSVALISAGRRDAAAAEALALDVAAWDQQGCLSPQGAFVEGSPAEVEAFGDLVAAELTRVEGRYPRGRLSAAEAARVRNFRAEAEARGLAGEGARLRVSGPSPGWTLLVEPDATFRPGPLNRTVTLWPVADLAEIVDRLRPWRGALQAAGLAVEPERETTAGDWARAAGCGWVVPLGLMQAPPLRWPNKGRDILADLWQPPTGGGER